jgi:prepilin-type N-terminal cleavage/methylation domain-containing protein
MIARIRKSLDEKEKGFTLIELLVVIIIIGILAAIAIPLFLNQRKKAVDSAARSDISTIGKEVSTWYVDNTAKPVLNEASGVYYLAAAASTAAADKISNASTGVTTTGATQKITSATDWCVAVKVTGGTNGDVSYSSSNGLQNNACP